ncbi:MULTISPECIES: Nif3-like dinuclear metal center hexameric protein [Pandoraea]|uniref:Nif3-like dinuclear metal center hexameric protein n=1 Tax=Pandoraea TaxID=93217 RepID=UPI001F5C9ACD|nr:MULTISPECIES: Nif3-like dinuclear metal center hexameric protein [Pandoraea]MCI3203668.1 Nif3-like dinuclear metal center hexameric protein [Pandoraea sp. LA3]MDN4581694.1 Nif3-like dinuclear metal center hexameric protein [Pandoraea capi]
MNRVELELYLNDTLQIAQFRDYCPNGLQVEGRAQIQKIATGVTASLAFLEAARDWGADAVLVHHGYFWKNEDARITGMKRKRLGLLIGHDINLFAFHLPLDAHPELGNNAQLGKLLGFADDGGRFGPDQLGWLGTPAQPTTLAALAAHVDQQLGRKPLMLGDPAREIRRVAWCTGGAQGFFEAAIAAGADVYISGEVSEPTQHLALESGVGYLAAGHHATERGGARAVGEHLAGRFGLEHRFFDMPNPA